MNDQDEIEICVWYEMFALVLHRNPEFRLESDIQRELLELLDFLISKFGFSNSALARRLSVSIRRGDAVEVFLEGFDRAMIDVVM